MPYPPHYPIILSTLPGLVTPCLRFRRTATAELLFFALLFRHAQFTRTHSSGRFYPAGTLPLFPSGEGSRPAEARLPRSWPARPAGHSHIPSDAVCWETWT